MTPYSGAIIYGPYEMSGKDHGRKNVKIFWPDSGKSKTIQYAKYLLEVRLGRYLSSDEHVHHIDGDKSNDSLENLTAISAREHRSMRPKHKPMSFLCPVCGATFELSADQVSKRLNNERHKGVKRGPYCSKRCNGKENH